jgi:hypothetical protein
VEPSKFDSLVTKTNELDFAVDGYLEENQTNENPRD